MTKSVRTFLIRMRPLLYIHGFASSAHSHKATLLQQHFDEVYAPSLSHIPPLAVETLETFLQALPRAPLLTGSSLGGYYALYLSQRYDLPAVLINPVVQMQTPLARVVGMNSHYFDGSRFEFTEAHLKALAAYYCPQPDTQKLLLMVEMGDELIDHRQTLEVLSGAEQIVTPDGDHAYRDLECHLESIRNFSARFA
jgi:predicted esterase YcpF (UPF0227 family)